jgi:hypothetical protein
MMMIISASAIARKNFLIKNLALNMSLDSNDFASKKVFQSLNDMEYSSSFHEEVPHIILHPVYRVVQRSKFSSLASIFPNTGNDSDSIIEASVRSINYVDDNDTPRMSSLDVISAIQHVDDSSLTSFLSDDQLSLWTCHSHLSQRIDSTFHRPNLPRLGSPIEGTDDAELFRSVTMDRTQHGSVLEIKNRIHDALSNTNSYEYSMNFRRLVIIVMKNLHRTNPDAFHNLIAHLNEWISVPGSFNFSEDFHHYQNLLSYAAPHSDTIVPINGTVEFLATLQNQIYIAQTPSYNFSAMMDNLITYSQKISLLISSPYVYTIGGIAVVAVGMNVAGYPLVTAISDVKPMVYGSFKTVSKFLVMPTRSIQNVREDNIEHSTGLSFLNLFINLLWPER